MDEAAPQSKQEAPPIPPLFLDLANMLADRLRRDQRSSAGYANNSRFEPSIWDLRVWFGQLEQRPGGPHIDWHTNVTVPWAQAKVMAYYLLVNIHWHERFNGRIKVAAGGNPVLMEQPTEDQLRADPGLQSWYEYQTKLFKEMFGE